MANTTYTLLPPEEIEGIVGHVVTDEEAKRFAEEVFPQMVEVLRKNGGIGLTAIQVGEPYKASIIHLQRGSPVFAFFNASYVPLEGRNQRYEGCLSYPDKASVKVKRHKKIRATFDMWDGEKLVTMTQKFTGFISRVFQHEVDHQNGITIYT